MWAYSLTVLLLVCGVLGNAPAAAAPSMIADVQVIALEPGRFLLRVQSNGPQAFDVLPTASSLRAVIRLYQAQLTSLNTSPAVQIRTPRPAARPDDHPAAGVPERLVAQAPFARCFSGKKRQAMSCCRCACVIPSTASAWSTVTILTSLKSGWSCEPLQPADHRLAACTGEQESRWEHGASRRLEGAR
ncbi:MAG: hypothetical protein FJZ47_02995, partial [Candidatus Tectomicrobia bacterium]|nr:hypothetical protein [Candidatus Tectomicrobia bacterium]